ncbi:MAG: hypothetical protein SGARI_003858, partial [Bacillariaceae sp.]
MASILPRFAKRCLSLPPTRQQKLIVVRHGETDWNRQLKVQGVTDIPLNAKGMLQAQASAQALVSYFHPHPKSPVEIHSSQMCRASETAQAIADALREEQWLVVAAHEELADGKTKTTPTTVTMHKELNEWNLGVLEGLTKEQALEKYPDEWNMFAEWADPLVSTEHAETAITEGESMEEVRVRAVNCLEDIMCVDQTSDQVVVSTHGALLAQLLRHVLVAQYPQDQQDAIRNDPATIDNLSKYHRPKNACITQFSIDPKTKIWEIEKWAVISHLK